MKASIDKSTSIIHEFCGDSVLDQAMIDTALAGGILLANIEIRTVTQADLDILLDARTQANMTEYDRFKAIERAIEKHMDTVAQLDHWDHRWTCVARAGYVNPWQAKGIKFAQWMDTCWGIAIQAQTDVIAGIRTIPTPDQAIAELPPMVW